MVIHSGIAHTAEIKFEFSKEYFKKSVKSNEFERPDQSKGRYRHKLEGFNTTVIFKNKYWLVVYMKVDLYKLANNHFVDESNCKLVCSKIDEYIRYYFGKGITHTKLIRFDYSVDIAADISTKKALLQIISQDAYDTVKYYKKEAKFDGSVYYNRIKKNKCKMTNQHILRKRAKKLLVYDKEKKEVGIIQYKDLLRFEIAFQGESLRYNMNYYKLEPTILAYMNRCLAKEFMVKEYKKVLFDADFHSKDVSIEKIKLSTYTWDMKRRLIAFIELVDEKGIDYVKNKVLEKNTKTKSKVVIEAITKEKFRNYISKLDALNINPITIPRDCEVTYIMNPVKLFKTI